MKQDKFYKELLNSLAIGMKKDFERANKKRAKRNQSPLSFSEFADTYGAYSRTCKKRIELIAYIVILILSLVIFGVPERIVEIASYIIALVITYWLLYSSRKKQDKMFEKGTSEIISVCKDKNIDIYNYLENEYWKR